MGSDDKIDDPVKKGKKKMWKICKCGCGWSVFGVVSLAVGIALIVVFNEYWNDSEHWERGLAYLGVAMICLGFVLVAAGLVFCGILIVVYRRMTGDHGTKTMFHPPKYEYGQAPYPQQPPFEPTAAPVPEGAAINPPLNPSAPQPSAPGDVHVEIKEHVKM